MEYATKESRLKSFEPPTKRSKAGWPHKSPTAEAVATAGFYYAPHKTGDDNVACFMCDRRLDGWEKDDDPIQEHLRHSPDCGYAIMMSLTRETHFDPGQMNDPTSTAMVEARTATFAIGWPHDGKRGWVCKTEKMVEAGWHFAPTASSEDYASCAYCKLSLDGWEPKDNPFDEHYRRNPECAFFIFAGTTAPSKRGKAKKGCASRTSRTSTASKASARLSTQSNLTVQSDIADLDDAIDTSTTSISSNLSLASTASKTKRKAAGTAKGGRAKKAKVAPEPEPEPQPEPVLDPEMIQPAEPEATALDETIENSAVSVMSTMSTATTKGKKKAGRPKATKTKKGKTTRAKTKKAEAEADAPEPEPEAAVVEPIVIDDEPTIQAEVAEAPRQEPETTAAKEVEPADLPAGTHEEEPELSSVVRDEPPQFPEQPQRPDLERATEGSPLQHKSSPYAVRSSPALVVHAHTSPLAAAVPRSPQKSPSQHSPARSDIENAPPSSLPPSSRPPQPQMTPSRTHLAPVWSPVDVDLVFAGTPGPAVASNLFDLAQAERLSDKERNMTVQEWIEYMAELAESDLRHEAERVVGVFEKEGARAMGVLEAVECL
ncbi:Protein bir1 [Cyphellophora attinorum]|uniref:Protein bir1 n=1 Tax=Cyphellophora attinorum TaxID=1664694 RepID=A0A0N0NRA0_9EURO|nr:Protein bir1 [Phialophora attinorum]KPI44589.1 Protein bir1 [Phialophora attinorum]